MDRALVGHGEGVMRIALETTPWNVQDHLQTPVECVLYLEAVFEEARDLGDTMRTLAWGDPKRASSRIHLRGG